jgi:hypothetical protein
VFGTQLALADPSRPPAAERVTKWTVELTLHMAIRRKTITQKLRFGKGRSSHFYQHFRALPFAGAEHDGTLWCRLMHRLAAAMRVAPEIKLAAPQLAAKEQTCGGNHYPK